MQAVDAAAAVMAAQNLGKRFGGLHAVRDVSLEIGAGEIHAVIGPNGAGKSTLINLLSGDLAPTAGTILLHGEPVTRLRPDRRGRAGIGRSYQKTTIFQNLSAFENARLAAQARLPGALSFAGRRHAREVVEERAAFALATVSLMERAATRSGLLSHGEQRALEIAMVLATEPKVVLLDEPLAGMGTAEARAMVGLIERLKEGRAVLIVEHDMDAVFALADRLTVMADGRVIASGEPQAVRQDPAVRAAYLGEGGH